MPSNRKVQAPATERIDARPGDPPDPRRPVVEGIVGVHLHAPVGSRIEIGERIRDSRDRHAAAEEHAGAAERPPNADARRPDPMQLRRRRFVQSDGIQLPGGRRQAAERPVRLEPEPRTPEAEVAPRHHAGRESGAVVLERLAGDAVRPREAAGVGRANVHRAQPRERADVVPGLTGTRRAALGLRGTRDRQQAHEGQGNGTAPGGHGHERDRTRNAGHASATARAVAVPRRGEALREPSPAGGSSAPRKHAQLM